MRRWTCAQRQLAFAAVILQREVGLAELERRLAPQLVDPLDLRAAHRNARLMQQPFGESRAAGLFIAQHDAGNENAPLPIAAHGQVGPGDLQRQELRLTRRYRPPGQHTLDAVEAEHAAAFAVVKLDALHRQHRPQAFPARADFGQTRTQASGVADRLRDTRFILLDTRHDPKSQRQSGSDQQDQCNAAKGQGGTPQHE